MTPPRESRRYLWWLGGGCALLLVMTVAGGVFGVAQLVQHFHSGGSLTCLPSDFPRYPKASTMSATISLDTAVHRCDMTFQSKDLITKVQPYYEAHLNSGDWRIDQLSPDSRIMTFRRQSNRDVTGKVQLSELKEGTLIEVTVSG